ncbi:hypothetical protein MMC25_002291 [Agyrium rufum]|nr:hypothetical protein [Agyrium rufum]
MDTTTFPPSNPANPRNWPLWRKWSIVIIILLIDLTVSFAASGFSPASKAFAKDFAVSSEVATLGLSLYVLGLAFGPMSLAPLSEYFGRSSIYIFSYGLFLLFLVGTALVKNLGGFLVLRFLSGLFSSVTIANFGGTIADLWPHDETGIVMSVFLWAATVGSPLGYLVFSFIAANYNWRTIFWALLGICGGLWLLLIAILKETRHTTILRQRAKAELKNAPTNGETGTVHVTGIDASSSSLESSPPNLEHRNAKELFQIALTRPFRFLFTEAIIIFAALYNGYLYGLSFLFNGAFSIVFGPTGYGFGTSEVGLAFLGIMIGISIGPVTNLWQEKLYQRRIRGQTSSKKGEQECASAQNDRGVEVANIPEARVMMGMVAAVVHPIALFWFAWTTFTEVHWIVPIIASAFWGWSFYVLILMTYMYLEDSYRIYSASALAGIGLVRNVAGAGFPLFAAQLFERVGNQWAVSLLAFLAILLFPIPYVLYFYGKVLRRRSPWARQHMDGFGEREKEVEAQSTEKGAGRIGEDNGVVMEDDSKK